MSRHYPADGDQFARRFDRLAILIREIIGKVGPARGSGTGSGSPGGASVTRRRSGEPVEAGN
jgi:hypothetical protein